MATKKLSQHLIDLKHVLSGTRSNLVLSELLGQVLSDDSLASRMYWLEEIIQWLFEGNLNQTEARFRFFLSSLDKNPTWKDHLLIQLNRLLLECQTLTLFTAVGITVDHGFWGDVMERVTSKFIPNGDYTDFRKILVKAFVGENEIEKLRSVSNETFEQVLDLFSDPRLAPGLERLHSQSKDAILILAAHATHYGSNEVMRSFLPAIPDFSQYSFIRLQRDPSVEVIENCEKDLRSVYSNLEREGVSVDIVNRLETATALLERMRIILSSHSTTSKPESTDATRKLCESIAEAIFERSTIMGFFGRQFFLLSKKIVERNGHSGEHYIAREASGFIRLFKSSIGGGIIVALMTVTKIHFFQFGLPPMLQAFGIWIIYSTGFLAMQLTHSTLATKIPSFTASRLATLLKRTRSSIRLEEVSEEFKLVLKSQGIALGGNIAGLLPLVLILTYAFKLAFPNASLIDLHYAHHFLEQLDPIRSFVVPLAFLTGVQLWLSSIAGGWFENWIVFRHIPSAIENHHRLRGIMGADRARKISAWIETQSSGIASNLALGFLFGFTPLLGSLFGLDWNGHHVTISTASATFAASALDFQLDAGVWISCIIGLFMIGLMNFSVSFSLALYIAASANRIKFRKALRSLTYIFNK